MAASNKPTASNEPEWLKTKRDIRHLAGDPPLTEAEVQREKRIRALAAIEKNWSSSQIDELTALLFGVGLKPSELELLRASTIESRRGGGISEGVLVYCRQAIFPLSCWPSDLVNLFGPEILFHPTVIRGVLALARIARDPRTQKARLSRKDLATLLPNPGRMTPQVMERVLRDDFEPKGLVACVKDELHRLHRALTNREAPSVPGVNRPLRVLVEHERLRKADGLSSGAATKALARATGRTEAAILSDLREGRKRLNIRTLPKHRRTKGIRLRPEELAMAPFIRAVNFGDELKSS